MGLSWPAGLIEEIWRTYSSKLVGELEGLVTKVARLDTGLVTEWLHRLERDKARQTN